MADDFVGSLVQLTLRQPPGTIVRGRVREVVAGEAIALEEVVIFDAGNADGVRGLGQGRRMGSWVVKGGMIEDIRVIPKSEQDEGRGEAVEQWTGMSGANTGVRPTAAARATTGPQAQVPIPPTAPVQAQHQPSVSPATQQTQSHTTSFVDPAILSYGLSPMHQRPVAQAPATPMKRAAEAVPPKSSSPFVGEPIKISLAQRAKVEVKKEVEEKARQRVQAPTPSVAGNGLGIDGTVEGTQAEFVGGGGGKKKKTRRGLKGKAAAQAIHDPPPVMNSDVSRNGNDMNGTAKRAKGWRQTPLLQPSPQPEGKTSVRKSRRQREEDKEAQNNGWATEDATDIQDLGEFDFEANHKLFDKKQIFDQMRQDDTTADEDRLVGHNRLPPARPGTYGGKNLHPSENVLSPKLAAAEDDSSDADTEMNFPTGNGRSSSRHSATKRQPSRQNSGILDGRHPFASSMSSERGISRSVASLSGRGGKPAPSPRPDRMRSPHSMVSSRAANDSPHTRRAPREPHLIIKDSRAPCPVLHPDALEVLETAAVSTYALTYEAMLESAARCIAEVAMDMFSDESSRRPSRTNTARGSATLHPQSPSLPVIVVLAGNHFTGACAVAAARHLACRKTKIIFAQAQHSSSPSNHHDEQIVKQTRILENMQHSHANIKRGPWPKAQKYIKTLSSPPALIIDALLAGTPYSSLSQSQGPQGEKEIIDWANRSRAPVLSLSIPSGYSALDGSTAVVEGEPLAVRPDRVLALGAPVQGLLEALKLGEKWDVRLADTGVNIAIREGEAVEFGRGWVVGLAFSDDGEEV